ncbi:hypothetical protein KGF57_003556 [Candida theae]|uniref:PSP1 C-terminal domain-containing protein n=1 Tax=Candida theae TaxID=1198502 RepID=A0AAD5BDI6_9ASCO|nr:uncharacterized protein KGF57_003556 [Candida theae]KAI5956070.1 hypothetical protein KGF57_003556 [Candida theae]
MAHNFGVTATARPGRDNGNQSEDYRYQHHQNEQLSHRQLSTEVNDATRGDDGRNLFHMPQFDQQTSISNTAQVSSPSFQSMSNLSTLPPPLGSSLSKFASNGSSTFWNTPLSGSSGANVGARVAAEGPSHSQYRGSSIDSSIWRSPSSVTSTGQASITSSLWSPTKLSGHEEPQPQQQPQQQQQQQPNFTSQYFSQKQPPAALQNTLLFPSNAKNYISTVPNENRSSSISAFTPPSMEEIAVANGLINEDSVNFSPPVSFESMRRHSYTEGLLGQKRQTLDVSPTLSKRQPSMNDLATMQMVDDYFESDPHERVKVTMKLLNDRFFDEERYLNDGYQLPKFPIESSLRNYQLVLVGFKAGRIDVFYLPSTNGVCMTAMTSPTETAPATASIGQNSFEVKVGDLVIVEADRGRDLGKVFKLNVSIDEARLLKLLQFQEQQAALNEPVENNLLDNVPAVGGGGLSGQNPQHTSSSQPPPHQQQQHHHHHQQQQHMHSQSSSVAPPTLQFPKSILALAQPNEAFQILNKKQDEEKACRLCLAKISSATSGCLLSGAPISPATQDLLQMKLIDAEYQFDRKKLIFYYSTSKRIDFRDLVRELFRIYKTRIWMCAVTGVPFKASRTSLSPLSTGVGSAVVGGVGGRGGAGVVGNIVDIDQSSQNQKQSLQQQAPHPVQFSQRPPINMSMSQHGQVEGSTTMLLPSQQLQQQPGLNRRSSFQQTSSTSQNQASVQFQGPQSVNCSWGSTGQLQHRASLQPQFNYSDCQFDAVPRQISNSEQPQPWSSVPQSSQSSQELQQLQQQSYWITQQQLQQQLQLRQQQFPLGQPLTPQQQQAQQVKQQAQKQVQDQFSRKNQGCDDGTVVGGGGNNVDEASMMQSSSEEKMVLRSLVDSMNH